MTQARFFERFDVSRETRERLLTYAELLQKWNPAINLVAPSTIGDMWIRHFVDSAQVAEIVPGHHKNWCDLGSGGGFPGVVTAILALETDPERITTCIESDQRKSAFLRTVGRETGAKLTVISERIEAAPQQNARIVSARALAGLEDLLSLASRHLAKDGECLFLKGRNYQREIDSALENWSFQYDTYPSKTNPDAAILRIGELSRA